MTQLVQKRTRMLHKSNRITHQLHRKWRFDSVPITSVMILYLKRKLNTKIGKRTSQKRATWTSRNLVSKSVTCSTCQFFRVIVNILGSPGRRSGGAGCQISCSKLFLSMYFRSARRIRVTSVTWHRRQAAAPAVPRARVRRPPLTSLSLPVAAGPAAGLSPSRRAEPQDRAV